MSELRHTVIYRVLHRPNLFMGGERELVLSAAIVCGGVAVSALNVVAAAVGLGVWSSCIGLFRAMAKADPYMTKIYLRYLNYRLYYPARSRAACNWRGR